MPIGNLTSQLLANVCLNELDQYVKHELRAHYYVRYMDDMVLLHQDAKVSLRLKIIFFSIHFWSPRVAQCPSIPK